MKKILLTGDEARRTLNAEKTKGRCGYYQGISAIDERWYVWDHRDGDLRGIRLNNEDSCKYWLSKGG